MNDLEKRLPSGYETVRETVVDSEFDCKERDTGFYADVENDCQASFTKKKYFKKLISNIIFILDFPSMF